MTHAAHHHPPPPTPTPLPAPVYTHIVGRPETFEPGIEHNPTPTAPLMPPIDGVYESIVGAPETWPPGTFEDDPLRDAPTISLLAPATGVNGTASLSVTVTGQNFSPDAVVRFMGVRRPTTFVGWTSLTALLDLRGLTAGSQPVTVQAANGVISNALPFAVT